MENRKSDEILRKFEKYNLDSFSHTDEGLISHLKGTYDILETWDCDEYLCVAGLCHSIYGTESYRNRPIDLSERRDIQEIIGVEAEEMAYFFGAHEKDSLWANLQREKEFKINDRLNSKEIYLSEEQLKALITLTLANWLEQRPRAPKEYLYIRKKEFLASEKYLPTKANSDFKKAYNL